MPIPTPVTDLIAQISGRRGLAPKNRFTVFVGVPAALNGIVTGDSMNLLCESVQMPSRDITTMEYQTYGRRRTAPSGANGNGVEITFLLTNDYIMKRLFDEWIKLTIVQDGSMVTFRDEIVSDITIRQLDQGNDFVYETKLEECYPIKVAPLDLSNTIQDDFQRLQVSFEYQSEVPSESPNN